MVPAESKIYDKLSNGNRPAYNKEFGVRRAVKTEERETAREQSKEVISTETSED